MESLPPLMALKTVYDGSTSPIRKYLGYVSQGSLQGHLRYSFSVLDQGAKFEVEPAKDRGSGLVHIRSCHNNKYWVRSSAHEFWIVAKATDRVEDELAWNCTLFRTKFTTYKGISVVQFVHVQLGCVVGMTTEVAHRFCLSVNPDLVQVAFSTVVDYGSLVILPKRVAFSGDNDKYLKAAYIEKHEYLQFGAEDLGSKLVVQEMFATDDGYFRIKNLHWGKFWRRSPNWIWADSTDTSSNNKDTLFWPVNVDNNDVIALRNMGNNLFCKRLTTEGKQSCLNAAIDSITKEARLQVFEPVFTRKVYVRQFRVDDARIYGQTPLVLGAQEVTNPTNNTQHTSLQFTHTETSSSTWANSISIKLGVKGSFSTGIPTIVDGKIEVSAEISEQYTWGSTETTTKQTQSAYNVMVPPWTKVKVTLVATQGKCDVPFSYTQTDQLTTGERVTVTLYDGVYTGVNAYNFVYTNKQESLSPEAWGRECSATDNST